MVEWILVAVRHLVGGVAARLISLVMLRILHVAELVDVKAVRHHVFFELLVLF